MLHRPPRSGVSRDTSHGQPTTICHCWGGARQVGRAHRGLLVRCSQHVHVRRALSAHPGDPAGATGLSCQTPGALIKSSPLPRPPDLPLWVLGNMSPSFYTCEDPSPKRPLGHPQAPSSAPGSPHVYPPLPPSTFHFPPRPTRRLRRSTSTSRTSSPAHFHSTRLQDDLAEPQTIVSLAALVTTAFMLIPLWSASSTRRRRVLECPPTLLRPFFARWQFFRSPALGCATRLSETAQCSRPTADRGLLGPPPGPECAPTDDESTAPVCLDRALGLVGPCRVRGTVPGRRR